MSGAPSDAALHQAFVSVRSQVQPVGAGVLITQNLVLTCAHVVNSALGRDRFTQAVPDRNQVVRLRMPHVSAGQEFHGRVVPEMWRPPRARRSGPAQPPAPDMLPYYGDLAVLELDIPAPSGAEPAPFLAHRDGGEVVALWTSGHELPTVRAVPRVSSGQWIALDVVGGRVAKGFSGSPLWDRERQAVVGVVVAEHGVGNARTTGAMRADHDGHLNTSAVLQAMYAIGLPTIESELPELPPVAVPMAARGRQQLLAALEQLLPNPQSVAECTRWLSTRLGRATGDIAVTDPARLVGLAMGVRRGIPELLDVVRTHLSGRAPSPDPYGTPGWAHLLRVARVVSPREILTLRQQRDLTGLLAHCRTTDPTSLLRKVLPYADGLPAVSSPAHAMEVLEGYEAPAGQPMPPLLQGAVRVSLEERESGAHPSDDLDAWVDMAAARFGIPLAGVEQFRADVAAEARLPHRADAGHGPHAPRVQIELLPVAPGNRFTYQIWVWTDGGRHDVVLTQDTEVSSHHVVESIRHVLRTEVEEHPETALVEYFVASAWLRLEVDTWQCGENGPDGAFLPGITRRVVLRSSQRTRETYAGWKRRTKALAASRHLVLDGRSADPAVAQAVLEINPDAGVVIVCCDRQRQSSLLQQCIQAGVHTVLWHRHGDGEDIAAELVNLVEGVDHHGLPEAVRMERAKALACPESPVHHGRQLSLLHDGPDHRPPPLAPDAWTLTHPDRNHP
ncbi:VMAP-C domain-containing protein [Streptomyces sp. GMR22]|uniref:VMAP-C domain-containing protein n=1 Tax=Streptomyces sp. GMR22 TaxID=2759524 RepID=UPI0015F9E68F|nr:trypsin-like peptidase domain-containing protein [Streptomyces sp. GMR22]MBA6437007.1 trypsin-like peptidase domain-containing protein [Streptomyces sp. GMR22]